MRQRAHTSQCDSCETTQLSRRLHPHPPRRHPSLPAHVRLPLSSLPPHKLTFLLANRATVVRLLRDVSAVQIAARGWAHWTPPTSATQLVAQCWSGARSIDWSALRAIRSGADSPLAFWVFWVLCLLYVRPLFPSRALRLMTSLSPPSAVWRRSSCSQSTSQRTLPPLRLQLPCQTRRAINSATTPLAAQQLSSAVRSSPPSCPVLLTCAARTADARFASAQWRTPAHQRSRRASRCTSSSAAMMASGTSGRLLRRPWVGRAATPPSRLGTASCAQRRACPSSSPSSFLMLPPASPASALCYVISCISCCRACAYSHVPPRSPPPLSLHGSLEPLSSPEASAPTSHGFTHVTSAGVRYRLFSFVSLEARSTATRTKVGGSKGGY
jgi:hypothetical protein